MPIFAYKGFNAAGKQITGTQDAESPRAIKANLDDLEEELGDASDGSGAWGQIQSVSAAPTADALWQIEQSWERVPPIIERINDVIIRQMPALLRQVYADAVRPERKHPDSLRGEALGERIRRTDRGVDLEEDHVRVDNVRRKGQALDLADRIGQRPGVGVIVGQTFDMMFECEESSGSDDARLTHGSAERFAAAACFGDPISIAAKC